MTSLIDNSETKPKEGPSELCECCLFCTLCTSGMALLGASISYLVFGIIFLINDYNIAKNCNGSSLWAYVLVALILSFSRTNSKNVRDDKNNVNYCVLVCLGLVECGLAIWGGIELFDKSCNDLKETDLWKFGLVTFILQSFLSSIILFIFPSCMVCCGVYEYCFKTDKKPNNIDNNIV